MTAAAILRAQKDASAETLRLEQEARRAEVTEYRRNSRPLLDRLHDAEHALLLDGYLVYAIDIREAIERLQSNERGET